MSISTKNNGTTRENESLLNSYIYRTYINASKNIVIPRSHIIQYV